jgi:pSer/pThr/pTyr-binding forkhead associated (FHA) protein
MGDKSVIQELCLGGIIMAKLIHRSEGSVIEEIALEKGVLRIGRQPENDVRLDDLAASGFHAQITVKPSEYMKGLNEVHVEDLLSTNGTIVDGKSIEQHILKHGEVVTIGTHEFTLVDEDVLAGERTRILIRDDE